MNYQSYKVSNIKELYVSLLNDNITNLLKFIYNNKNKEPYNIVENRVAVALQLLLSSNKLLPADITSEISKDLNDLKLNESYLQKFPNKDLKIKQLNHEIKAVMNHTELDDSVSLNISTNELSSSISTLYQPKASLMDRVATEEDKCSIM